MTASAKPAARTQLQSDDVAKPENLRRVLNDILVDLYKRLEFLEGESGVTVLDVELETGAVVNPTTKPFLNGGVRVAVPFPPTGVMLLSVRQLKPSASAVSTSAQSLQWRPVTGPLGDSAIILDFVAGLAVSSKYRLRIGVTHG